MRLVGNLPPVKEIGVLRKIYLKILDKNRLEFHFLNHSEVQI